LTAAQLGGIRHLELFPSCVDLGLGHRERLVPRGRLAVELGVPVWAAGGQATWHVSGLGYFVARRTFAQ
jgi:hypothetical protein